MVLVPAIVLTVIYCLILIGSMVIVFWYRPSRAEYYISHDSPPLKILGPPSFIDIGTFQPDKS